MAGRADVTRGAVVGGGLLGLEAANALRLLGLQTHVVEFADRLMPAQLDERGSDTLRRHVERLGLVVHTSMRTEEIHTDPASGRVVSMTFDGADPLDVDIVVFSAGIRPRDELARGAGLELGERGGVVVDDQMRTSDPSISAVGEVACHLGRCYGLVAPGNAQARVAAAHVVALSRVTPSREVSTDDVTFDGADMSTKLKLLGVEVGCIGTLSPDAHHLVWDDPVAGIYKRLDVDPESGRILACVLVGDATAYPSVLRRYRDDGLATDDPGRLIAPIVTAGGPDHEDAPVCSCENVSRSTVIDAIRDGGASIGELKACTRAGTGCGGCLPDLEVLLRTSGAAPAGLCAHVPLTRAELYDLIRLRGLRDLPTILAATNGDESIVDGCEICKPVIASIVATLDNAHILDGEQAAWQDTNDHFLANLQRDGTYSVVPRIPGGEITPDKLIVIGEVARDFGLYTKITGGQRIDLLGATLDQLPAIWRRLVEAGMESGHAYGKSLRTVKSCVGSTWCRYGVQDSTAMAIRLEERYRGLRSPHKLKLAVSGCARECAEAQSKDVGVIATDHGWNLYVGGNGGKTPRHAVLMAEGVDDDTLVAYIDRFLMYYIRTADRLERTAPWLERLDGGMEQLRRVVVDDVLGLAAEFEADVERHVAGYECEWKATLERPDRLARFVTYVNAPGRPDPSIVFVSERGQLRPARPEERPELAGVAS
jgi:nitrite reductase (NADH) large subunit